MINWFKYDEEEESHTESYNKMANPTADFAAVTVGTNKAN